MRGICFGEIIYSHFKENLVGVTFINPSSVSATQKVGSFGAIVAGSADNVVNVPSASGTISLGLTQIASGIINLYPGSGSMSSGSATIAGLESTDIVLTSFDSDATGSAQFFSKFLHGSDTLVAYGQLLSGSYAECHYMIFRP